MASVSTLEKIARRLRIHSLKMTTAAGSGHPTTCLSSAEIMSCLLIRKTRLLGKMMNLCCPKVMRHLYSGQLTLKPG